MTHRGPCIFDIDSFHRTRPDLALNTFPDAISPFLLVTIPPSQLHSFNFGLNF